MRSGYYQHTARYVHPRTALVGLLVGGLGLSQSRLEAQSAARATPGVPVVVVLPFALANTAVPTDSTAIQHGLAALLARELSTGKRVRVARLGIASTPVLDAIRTAAGAAAAARASKAAYAVIGDVTRARDSVRVTLRIVRARDSLVRTLDEFATGLDDIPTLVDDLAHAVADSVAPTRDPTRGGPLFRPPKPSVPFAAITLYSKAVSARAAGDADTAVRLLRQASTLAPQWEQPKRDLLALRPKR